jgi:hypothetical protein
MRPGRGGVLAVLGGGVLDLAGGGHDGLANGVGGTASCPWDLLAHILILLLQPVGRNSVDAATATVIAATISAIGGVVVALMADSSKRDKASKALESAEPSIPLHRSSSVAKKAKPAKFRRIFLNIALVICAIFYVLSCVFAASFFSLAIFQEPGFLIIGPIVGLLFGLISVAGFSSQIDFES